MRSSQWRFKSCAATVLILSVKIKAFRGTSSASVLFRRVCILDRFFTGCSEENVHPGERVLELVLRDSVCDAVALQVEVLQAFGESQCSSQRFHALFTDLVAAEVERLYL